MGTSNVELRKEISALRIQMHLLEVNLQKSEKFKDIPVVVASNLGQSDDIVRATKLGARDYIVKTDLSMKKLIEKLNEILSRV